MPLRFLTSGDSHGPALVGVLEGIPAGLPINEDMIAADLIRRQKGHGSGGRMKIEKDRARITSGMWEGKTSGAPLGLIIENLDFQNWIDREPPLYSVPRPGHADYAGAVKYGFDQTRPISERASARETAMRVAMGAVARALLKQADTEIFSRVTRIGPVDHIDIPAELMLDREVMRSQHIAAAESPVRCPDEVASKLMMDEIDKAQKAGDTLGGIVEVFAFGLPVGLGSHIQWDKRLDSRLAGALMSIPAVKAVEIGAGEAVSRLPGSEVQDVIESDSQGGTTRRTNRAGGIEGGISNGMPVTARVHIKPIGTLHKTLMSVDLQTGKERKARYQRSDVCVVARGSAVVEAVFILCLADALLETFGSDRLDYMLENIQRMRDIRFGEVNSGA